jgi:hypothetical protein
MSVLPEGREKFGNPFVSLEKACAAPYKMAEALELHAQLIEK